MKTIYFTPKIVPVLGECAERCGLKAVKAPDIDAALLGAVKGDIVFCAADYPGMGAPLTKKHVEAAKERGCFIYSEYPSELLGELPDGRVDFVKERLVLTEAFGELEKFAILMTATVPALTWNNLDFSGGGLIMCAAKIAGFDKAVYGLPERTFPVLWESGGVIVSSMPLSIFAEARFSPVCRWKQLWKAIFARFGADIAVDYTPTVRASFGRCEKLPGNYADIAAKRNVEWLTGHMLCVGDSDMMVFEGMQSEIDYRGGQYIRNFIRADCLSESAMELALYGKLRGDGEVLRCSDRLLRYLFNGGGLAEKDKTLGQYGLIRWHNRPGVGIYYGDDNARVLLAALTARAYTGNTEYDFDILKCAAANLLTSSYTGFRYGSINSEELAKRSHADFQAEEFYEYAPHYQCYIWAVYLWVYSLTGLEVFRDAARKGIYAMMEKFTDGLRWTNSLTAEIARMLLPLSLLVRFDPSEAHTALLKRGLDALYPWLTDEGAVRDGMGQREKGCYPSPLSNESYGKNEASIIQNNGDPATDLLYCCNWAFLGLHEAGAFDSKAGEAYNRMAEFLCRIQTSSEVHPMCDGVWMRCFDFHKWEYWASSADAGWGAYSVETGWTNSWIASMLMLSDGRSITGGENVPDMRGLAAKLVEEFPELKK